MKKINLLALFLTYSSLLGAQPTTGSIPPGPLDLQTPEEMFADMEESLVIEVKRSAEKCLGFKPKPGASDKDSELFTSPTLPKLHAEIMVLKISKKLSGEITTPDCVTDKDSFDLCMTDTVSQSQLSSFVNFPQARRMYAGKYNETATFEYFRSLLKVQPKKKDGK